MWNFLLHLFGRPLQDTTKQRITFFAVELMTALRIFARKWKHGKICTLIAIIFPAIWQKTGHRQKTHRQDFTRGSNYVLRPNKMTDHEIVAKRKQCSHIHGGFGKHEWRISEHFIKHLHSNKYTPFIMYKELQYDEAPIDLTCHATQLVFCNFKQVLVLHIKRHKKISLPKTTARVSLIGQRRNQNLFEQFWFSSGRAACWVPLPSHPHFTPRQLRVEMIQSCLDTVSAVAFEGSNMVRTEQF